VWQIGVGLPTEQANATLPSVDRSDGGGKQSKSGEKEGLGPVSHGNVLDNSKIWKPNGRQPSRRASHSGRLSDERSFSPQRDLPCDGTSCRYDFGGLPCAVPAIFSQFEYPRLALAVLRQGMLPTLPERSNRQSVGLGKCAGPMQSGEECFKKSISTSVVVALAFRREWF
jgi:hypothetical protein